MCQTCFTHFFEATPIGFTHTFVARGLERFPQHVGRMLRMCMCVCVCVYVRVYVCAGRRGDGCVCLWVCLCGRRWHVCVKLSFHLDCLVLYYHTATHCNPLQPTATHCNTLQQANKKNKLIISTLIVRFCINVLRRCACWRFKKGLKPVCDFVE